MLSLREQMAADVEDVFLNTDDFAQVIRHYPDGDIGGPGHEVTAIFEIDQEQSGNNLGGSSIDGDGLNPSSERGVTVRHSATIELPITETVNEQSGITPPSLFVVDYLDDGAVLFSEFWHAIRPLGHDAALQTYLLAFVSKHVTRRAMRQ